MNVRVRLFASYADNIGRSELLLELPEGSTVAQAISCVAALPGGSVLPAAPLAAVNCEYALPHRSLSSGDELALIPPVAGG